MPRPSYGSETQKRTQQFLLLLLDFACDQLEGDEKTLDRLRTQIQTHWQTDRRLIVRTKVRFLEALTQLSDHPLSGDQIKEVLKRLADFLDILEDNRPHRSGSEVWHFTLNLWHSRHDRAAILDRFTTEWQQRRPPKSPSLSPSLHSPIPAPPLPTWPQRCKTSLQAQQYERLTTNPLTFSDGVTFARDQVYVPLGLIERTARLPDPDASLEEAEAAEAGPILSLEQFLQRLIAGQTQRIAIVGEPGAGKTTLLQKVADWLLEQDQLPIWVALADLQGQTLEQYLLQDWLKLATCEPIVSSALQQELAAQFRAGRVWLLLDAVDEMAIDAGLAFSLLARQLRGWIGAAQVILTCRLNVWGAGKNALENFATYHSVGFSENARDNNSDEIGQFIQGWFHDRPALGQQLRQELGQRRRLSSLVQNPLRLALLCRSWSLSQGNLPQTRAALYQQFVEAIYEWKQDRFPTSLTQRQSLNRALGDLAIQALRQPDRRFRLRSNWLLQTMAGDQITLALQLGWLNQSGFTATGEKLYAFYHPTFQEYFAAQTITDWQFFLDLSLDPPLDLPLFSSTWRQPLLLWFGRSEVPIDQKESLMAALLQFADDCGGFYQHQAVLLAAAGLAEFPESRYGSEILQQLLRWRWGEVDPVTHQFRIYPAPLQEAARMAILQTDRTQAIRAIEEFLKTQGDVAEDSAISQLFSCWVAAYSLGKTLDPGNPVALQALVQLLGYVRDSSLQLKVSESIGKIDPGNPTAIAQLTQLIQTAQAQGQRRAAYALAKIDPGNPLAIHTLMRLITTAADLRLRRQSLENLIQVDPTHPIVAIVQTYLQSRPARPSKPAAKQRSAQRPIDPDQRVAELADRLQRARSAEAQRREASRLGQLQLGHPLAVETLLKLLLTGYTPKRTAEDLRSILLEEQMLLVITTLKPQVQQAIAGDRSIQVLECYKLLWFCAQQLPFKVFQQAWQSEGHII